MKKELRYSRMYLGLFSIVGLICGVLFYIVSTLLDESMETSSYFAISGTAMFVISTLLLAGVVFVRKTRILGSILISFGSALFILAISYSLVQFAHIFKGISQWIIPIFIWLPLCTPFAIIMIYIWRWSRQLGS